MKTQMKFQKILCIVCLITGALGIVLSLFYCSGILYAVTQTDVNMPDDYDLFNAYSLYEYSQQQNDTLIIMSIILVVMAAMLFFMQCANRRNYYISNYIAIGLFAAYALAYVIAVIAINGTCFGLMSKIDYAAWQEREAIKTSDGSAFRYPQLYTKNCTSMVLFIVLAVVVLAEIVAWVLNLIWKIKLMKGEKELLKSGEAHSTAEMEVA